MSDTHNETDETESVQSDMNIIAQTSIEAPQSDLDRVLADFTEDELMVRQPPDTHSGDRYSFEVQAGEEEALLRFHETCAEHDIPIDVKRLCHQ